MASSNDDRCRALSVFFFVSTTLGALVASGCASPSKSDALEIVKRDVKEDADCTLPLEILSSMKTQHATKAACVPKEAVSDKAQACMTALVEHGVTSWMPASYMTEWPDEVAIRSLADMPAYERRARNLLFRGCVAMSADLREGRFKCGSASADRVLELERRDDAHATVRYARTLALDPKLAELDRACGAITRPPGEATAALERSAPAKKWAVAPPAPAAN